MDSAGFVTIAGSSREGSSVVRVTVMSSTFSTVMPFIRKFALDSVIPCTRVREKTTSSAFTVEPSEKVRPSTRVKVKEVASSFCSIVASEGIGSSSAEPSNVRRVS